MEDIAAAIPVWARDAPEEKLLLESLEQASRLGFPLYLADGGSRPGFIEQVRQLPNVVSLAASLPGGPRLLTQVRQCLIDASAGARFILYCEPDKRQFYETHARRLCDRVSADCTSRLVIAARDAASFATFPHGQRLTQSLTNHLCEELFGQAGDYMYGPFILSATVVPQLHSISSDIGWGWRPYLMVLAHRLGMPIELHTGAFECPPDQRDEDDLRARVYRIRQMSQNAAAIAMALELDLPGNA